MSTKKAPKKAVKKTAKKPAKKAVKKTPNPETADTPQPGPASAMPSLLVPVQALQALRDEYVAMEALASNKTVINFEIGNVAFRISTPSASK